MTVPAMTPHEDRVIALEHEIIEAHQRMRSKTDDRLEDPFAIVSYRCTIALMETWAEPVHEDRGWWQLGIGFGLGILIALAAVKGF